ncbi:hypothetical protein IFM89_019449 [Coptis chinensis]|uniref:Large ribosomal subunit protein bL9c n=1 Tax=Coptis chinensis TaxID=261450 RepID=A0A835LJV3_9MAGN|nr:hypothetical protein IFM89_019449 [Coptis chinensis]
MASTTTLAWNSSSLFSNTTPNINTPSKISHNQNALFIFAQKKAQKTRKIILKEDVAQVGKKGDLKDVKAGFYRNYLHPLGMAQIVTPTLLKEMRMEEERIEAEKKRIWRSSPLVCPWAVLDLLADKGKEVNKGVPATNGPEQPKKRNAVKISANVTKSRAARELTPPHL